jgi:predicted Zn-dependent protease with MMP-like domain
VRTGETDSDNTKRSHLKFSVEGAVEERLKQVLHELGHFFGLNEDALEDV